MKMSLFSNCSGSCCVCGCGGGCLAGNGDDDFYPAAVEEIIRRLEYNEYPGQTDFMIQELKDRGVIWTGEVGSKEHTRVERNAAATDDEVKAIVGSTFRKE